MNSCAFAIANSIQLFRFVPMILPFSIVAFCLLNCRMCGHERQTCFESFVISKNDGVNSFRLTIDLCGERSYQIVMEKRSIEIGRVNETSTTTTQKEEKTEGKKAKKRDLLSPLLNKNSQVNGRTNHLQSVGTQIEEGRHENESKIRKIRELSSKT